MSRRQEINFISKKVKSKLNKIVFKNKYEISKYLLDYTIKKWDENETIINLRDRIIELEKENVLLSELCSSFVKFNNDREKLLAQIKSLEIKISTQRNHLEKQNKALLDKK